MKKLLGILVLGLLATSCSENETDMVQTCADEKFYKEYKESDFIFRHTGLTAYKYIEKDLKFKLKKYGGYDTFFKKCEREAKEYPKAFKAKY